MGDEAKTVTLSGVFFFGFIPLFHFLSFIRLFLALLGPPGMIIMIPITAPWRCHNLIMNSRLRSWEVGRSDHGGRCVGAMGVELYDSSNSPK